jgi:hypothetical protein
MSKVLSCTEERLGVKTVFLRVLCGWMLGIGLRLVGEGGASLVLVRAL